MNFVAFPKVSRWYRDIVVTEKIDGTNGSIWIAERGDLSTDLTADANEGKLDPGAVYVVAEHEIYPARAVYEIRAGSRSRFIWPGNDNHGFARWVYSNADALVQLGVGVHHGEWWGEGIQRGYGREKTFSLFNTGRWSFDPQFDGQEPPPTVQGLDIVPVLYRGPLSPVNGVDPVQEALRRLEYSGSVAAPRFMRPEGVVVWHEAGRVAFKSTLGDDRGKSQ